MRTRLGALIGLDATGENMNEPLKATLASTLWPSRGATRLARAATLAIAGTLVLAAAAKI